MSTEHPTYFVPNVSIPDQTVMVTSQAILTPSYMLLPATSIADNVVSNLPNWEKTKCWALATPALSSETTFVQTLMYVAAGGGSEEPEDDNLGIENFIFVLEGQISLIVTDEVYEFTAGGFIYLPPDTVWSMHNHGTSEAKFLWIRKKYQPIKGGKKPKIVFGNEQNIPPKVNATCETKWSTQLIPTGDIAYDMHININTFGPGNIIPIIETHVMEHGLYMLQGKGVYLLNDTWHEVQAGDFIWMHPFCPQAFYAGGPGPARYILYKDMNRHFPISR